MGWTPVGWGIVSLEHNGTLQVWIQSVDSKQETHLQLLIILLWTTPWTGDCNRLALPIPGLRPCLAPFEFLVLQHPCRFSYCALLCLSILDRMERIDVEAAVKFIVRCKNFDGGFGCTPGMCGSSSDSGWHALSSPQT